MRVFLKLIFWLIVPVVVITVLAGMLGYNSVDEMVRALVEQIIPFGNLVSSLLNTQAIVSIGKPVTVSMILVDIIKTLMASFLFTFVMRFVNIVMKITSKSVISYFFAECAVSILLAVVCGFALEKLHDWLSGAIGQVASITAEALVLAVVIFLWFRLMLSFGTLATVAANFLIFRKLIPSILRMFVTYVFAATFLLVMTSEELSSSILPLVIALYGIIMILSSLFERWPIT